MTKPEEDALIAKVLSSWGTERRTESAARAVLRLAAPIIRAEALREAAGVADGRHDGLYKLAARSEEKGRLAHAAKMEACALVAEDIARDIRALLAATPTGTTEEAAAPPSQEAGVACEACRGYGDHAGVWPCRTCNGTGRPTGTTTTETP